MSHFQVKQVAVLGAGVMGAQIAAHFANAGVPVRLYDLPSEGKDKSIIANKAILALKKIKPAPLANNAVLEGITAGNYETDLELLRDCDLIIEAIAEKLEWKYDLYSKISPYLADDAILATNTSGIRIAELANGLPEKNRATFCGVHFFNPPRYLPLVELIPHQGTNPEILDNLETFFVTSLGKSVVRAKDTPNFIGNRLGVFSLLSVMKYAEKYQVGFDVADALTGKLIGRPNSATFRTADVVGLDTLVHVVNNTYENAKDDPWNAFYEVPVWLSNLIANGALGAKNKNGIYKKIKGKIFVYDLNTGEYREANQKPSKEVVAILKEKNVKVRFEKLFASNEKEAKMLSAMYRDSFHYAAYHLPEIAENVRDADLALRWGFGWKQGLFEIWQQAGSCVEKEIESANANGETIITVDFPAWTVSKSNFYDTSGKAYNPNQKSYDGRSSLPVYKKQPFFDAVLNEKFDNGTTVFENESVRAWTSGDNILVVSVKTKMGTIGSEVLSSFHQATEVAERDGFDAIVIWHNNSNFSAGANLEEFGMAYMLDGADAVMEGIENFQKALLALRYCQVPVVSAVKGFVFGGGCELMLHCDRTVAALETYIGLVEVGVGLVPAGGGCKEMTLRASKSADYEKTLQEFYKNIAMGEVSKSAKQAVDMGYLTNKDVIVMNKDELLTVAKANAKAMATTYRAPFKPQIKVLGTNSAATIWALLANMKRGKFISDYDEYIGRNIANIVTGGNVDCNTVVDEEWLLRLERKYFVEQLENQKTQDRIQHILTTGKPLRN